MVKLVSMKTVMAATDVRNNLGKLLHEVYRGDKHVMVEKGGIPVAALISMKDYEEFRRWLAQDLHQQLGRELGAEFKRRGITEEKLIDLMEEERKAGYEQQYGSSS